MPEAPSAPAVTGPWLKVDDTGTRLELALTAEDGLLALTSTLDPGRTIYVTPAQVTALADQVSDQESEIGQLIRAGSPGGM